MGKTDDGVCHLLGVGSGAEQSKRLALVSTEQRIRDPPTLPA